MRTRFAYGKPLLVCILLCFLLTSYAASPSGPVLRVGLLPFPPLVIGDLPHPSGVVVELWEAMADAEDINYEYIMLTQNVNAAAQMVANNQVDVVIGAISATTERLQWVLNSQPYFLNKIGLTIKKENLSVWRALQPFMQGIFILGISCFGIAFFLHANLIWYYERHQTKKIPRTYFKGIGYLLWCHLLGLRPLEDVPTTFPARVSWLLWGLASGIFFVAIAASLSSAVTLSILRLNDVYAKPSDLAGKTVACIKGTVAIGDARRVGTHIIEVANFEEALALLQANKVTAIIHNYSLMKYYLETHDVKFATLSSLIVGYHGLTFAVGTTNYDLDKKITRSLLTMQEKGLAQAICRQYMTEEESLNCQV